MSKRRLIVATGNAGKLKEIKSILTEYEVVGAKELGLPTNVEENGTNFCENATIKARTLKQLTDCTVLADDSGLCVDALGGAPGIFTARYAGENATDDENIDKMLSVMNGIPKEKRTARFCCTMCLIDEQGNEIYGEGGCEGYILEKRAGCGGFGYDPIFYVAEFDQSFGELSEEQKNRISHRKRALEDLKEKLR